MIPFASRSSFACAAEIPASTTYSWNRGEPSKSTVAPASTRLLRKNAALARFCSASSRKPSLPYTVMKIVTIIATSAWFVQMFEVAFSRRICCSRVDSVSTKPRLPFTSLVSPTSRPGICRRNFSLHAITPQYGPPNPTGTPKLCASSDTMSASRGGFTTPSETASAIETISRAPFRCTTSAMPEMSSITPKKFGDCTSTAAVSSWMEASSACRSTRPVFAS